MEKLCFKPQVHKVLVWKPYSWEAALETTFAGKVTEETVKRPHIDDRDSRLFAQQSNLTLCQNQNVELTTWSQDI